MADVNSTFKVYISTEPVFKVYVNNGAKGDSGTNGTDGVDGEGVASGGFTGQFLIKLSEEDFDTGWSNIDSTQVSYGDGTVSEGLDNRYTKGETDLLLDDKSNVGHTHDDRYYTETEVGVLLSGKSDTTHNHDLTYAPIVHNHDDIYYTDDEVDTLLLSKSDTTHTHDLIKNATEANAKIEASSTGAVITRNVNDANAVLKVNQQNASSTGNILDLQFGGVSKAYVSRTGNITAGYLFTPNGMGNSTTMNNALVSVPSTGTLISRDVADTNSVLTVDNVHASSSGYLLNLKTQGETKAFISREGVIYGSGIFNVVASSNSKIDTGLNGVVLTRNVADANPALIVNQANASSTGDILNLRFNGTQQAYITKDGRIHTREGLSNYTTANNSNIRVTDAGTTITRNVADTSAALRVNQINAGSTGSILVLQSQNVDRLAVDINGNLYGNSTWVNYISNYSSSANARATLGTTGTTIDRNIADANSVLIVNNRNASSTGNIAEFQFNGTTKLAIDKNGLIAQEAWIQPTLVNGWVSDPLTDVNGLGYYKDTLGVVRIMGSIRNGTTTFNTTLFTLPVGYRPTRTVRQIPIREAGGFATITINTDGTVVLGTTIVNNVWVALTNIQFRVA